MPGCLPYMKKVFQCKNGAKCSQPANQIAASRSSLLRWFSAKYLLLPESDCLSCCVAVSPAYFYPRPNCQVPVYPIPVNSSFPYLPFRKQQSHSRLFSAREQVYRESVEGRHSRNVPTICRLPKQPLYPTGSYQQSNRLLFLS